MRKEAFPTDSAKNALVARAFIALAVGMIAMKIHAEVSITFSSTQGGINQQSTGAPLDNSFTFELGAFKDNFVPTSSNTDMWSDKWVALTDPAGNTAAGAVATYGPITDIFGSTYDGFNSTTDLEHNNAPFGAGEQAYVWGFDGRGAGDHEWVLITNDLTDPADSAWLYTASTGTLSFFETWDVASADNAIIGGVNFQDPDDKIISLETAAVSVVPEPSTALILGVGVTMFGLRRRPRGRPNATR